MIEGYETIKIEFTKEILSITLNRPEKRNALNAQMVKELNEVFLRFGTDDSILGLMLTGSGESFCAGADLAYLRSLKDKSDQENLQDSNNLKDLFWNIYTFPKPTLALVNGPAVAGGCGLMSVFDVAIASERAKFGYPEVRIGFVAALVSVFLVQIVGLRHTKHLLLTGNLIDSKRAEKIGLIQEVVSHNSLQDTADTFFDRIRDNSAQAVKQTKHLLTLQWGKQLHGFLDEASEFNAKARNSEDFQEGLISFLEKRDPVWKK